MPQSPQPVLLIHAELQRVAAQDRAHDRHSVACRPDVPLAWMKRACLLLPGLCEISLLGAAACNSAKQAADSIQVHARSNA